MSNTEFKAGDLVYFPALNTSVNKLSSTSDVHGYSLTIGGFDTFTHEGKLRDRDISQMIFHATEENCELLSKLYGVQFEKPKKVLKGSDLTRKLLADGKWVICKVSDLCEQHAPENGYLVIVKNFDTEDQVFETAGNRWSYAVPYAVIDPINPSKPMGIEI